MQSTKTHFIVGGLLFLVLTSCNVHSEALLPDPAWQQGKLDNGFSWQILATPQRPTDRIELRMLVNTGSLMESPQQIGFSYLLPYLALKQNQLENASQFKTLEQQGKQPISMVFSSYDYTSYNISLPNNRPEILLAALQWFATIANTLSIEANTLTQALYSPDDRVKTVPNNVNDPWWRVRLKGSTLLGHEPGQSPNSPVDAKKLQDFYDKWYTPDVMTLYVVGNVDTRTLSEQINRIFSGVEGQRQVATIIPMLSPLSESTVALIGDATQKNDELSLIWDTLWQPIRDEQMLLSYWKSDLAREALFWHLQQAVSKSPLKNNLALTFDCQAQYQRSLCAIRLNVDRPTLRKALHLITTEMAFVRDGGILPETFMTLLTHKNEQLDRLFATYARTDTDILIEQRLRSQRRAVVDIAPEAYQKLRQRFLATLTLEALNQELHSQLLQEPVLVLRQPQGEAEEDVKALLADYNHIMGFHESSTEETAIEEKRTEASPVPQAPILSTP